MKKALALALICSMALCFAMSGCGKQSQSNTGAGTDNNSSIEQQTEPEMEEVNIHDKKLGDIWVKKLAGVPLNALDNDNFSSDGTFMHYYNNGNLASVTGIDVSSYSGDINWQEVKNSGVDFVMVRIGGRGYGDEGTLYSDDKAVQYINEAHNAGLKVGGYFFSQAITTAEAVEEAEYIKSIIGNTKLEFPVAYDWEIIEGDTARTDDVPNSQATACAKAFCDKVRELGYKPMLYAGSPVLYNKLDLSQLKGIDIWYSQYDNVPDFLYQFSMWQYSEKGHINGIEGNVDMNICFTDIADYA